MNLDIFRRWIIPRLKRPFEERANAVTLCHVRFGRSLNYCHRPWTRDSHTRFYVYYLPFSFVFSFSRDNVNNHHSSPFRCFGAIERRRQREPSTARVRSFLSSSRLRSCSIFDSFEIFETVLRAWERQIHFGKTPDLFSHLGRITTCVRYQRQDLPFEFSKCFVYFHLCFTKSVNRHSRLNIWSVYRRTAVLTNPRHFESTKYAINTRLVWHCHFVSLLKSDNVVEKLRVDHRRSDCCLCRWTK